MTTLFLMGIPSPVKVFDIVSLTRLKDESLEDSENLPAPDILAREITDNLGSALEQFSGIYEDLTEG
jgi:hypothetical protein